MILVLADHPIISAVPFLVPALIIVLVLAFYIVRDRRNGGADDGDALYYDEDEWAQPTPDPRDERPAQADPRDG